MKKVKVNQAQIIKVNFRPKSLKKDAWKNRNPLEVNKHKHTLRTSVDAMCYICVGKPQLPEAWAWLIGSCKNRDCPLFSVRNSKFQDFHLFEDRPANIKDVYDVE